MDKSLNGLHHIAKSTSHPSGFKEAERHAYCRFHQVLLSYRDFVIKFEMMWVSEKTSDMKCSEDATRMVAKIRQPAIECAKPWMIETGYLFGIFWGNYHNVSIGH